MKKFIPIASLVLAAPMLASAQAAGNLGNVDNFLSSFSRLVSHALPIIVGLALLGFFWGLANFILSGADMEKQKGAKSMMIWSIVALFLMVSVWGLVNFLGSTLGVGQGSTGAYGGSTAPPVPTVPGLGQ